MKLKEKMETAKQHTEDFLNEYGHTLVTVAKTGLFVGGVSYLLGYLYGYRDGMTWIKLNDIPVKTIDEFVEGAVDEVQ